MKDYGLGRLALSIFIGLILALLCLAAGLMVVGMGHGWELPFKYGWLSLLFYPLAVMRLRWIRGPMPWRIDAQATATVALPILALLVVVGGPGYFLRTILSGWPILIIGIPACWFIGRMLDRSGRAVLVFDAILLAAAVALDLAALLDFSQSPEAMLSGALLIPWLIVWLGWQAVVAMALLRHLRGTAAALP